MRFEIIDIDDNEWRALDFLLEDVERGNQREEVLLSDEIFLHMLSAVKFNTDNFMKIPHFIRASELCKKYCQQVNPSVIEILNEKTLSKIEIYRKYLGL